MDIQNITHTCSKTADCKVDTTIQPLQWFPVSTESTLAPGIITIDAGAAQQTEGQLVVCWQTVLCAKVERSCQSGSTATLVAQILQVDEVGNLVAIVIYLVIKMVEPLFSLTAVSWKPLNSKLSALFTAFILLLQLMKPKSRTEALRVRLSFNL